MMINTQPEEHESMTQPEVSMTPSEVLEFLDSVKGWAVWPAKEREEVYKARAAVAEVVSERDALNELCDKRFNEIGNLRAERDALRRRVEELEAKLERDVQAAQDKYTRPQGMTRS